MLKNPRAWYQSTTRTTLTFVAVFDTFESLPVNVPLAATDHFDVHAIIITPIKMTVAACDP